MELLGSMGKTISGTLGLLSITLITFGVNYSAQAASFTWKVKFFDEFGAAFGGGNFVVDTQPQTFFVLETTPSGFVDSTYTTPNVVTLFDFNVGEVAWSSTEMESDGYYTRWIGDNDVMGRVFRSGYPTDFVVFDGWSFIDTYGSVSRTGRVLGKSLNMQGLFRPGRVNTWDMYYLGVPFERWGQWYSDPANSGKEIPRYNLRGTWIVSSTPEPGMTGVGLMVLGLWGIRQRSRRLQQSGSRTIDS